MNFPQKEPDHDPVSNAWNYHLLADLSEVLPERIDESIRFRKKSLEGDPPNPVFQNSLDKLIQKAE